MSPKGRNTRKGVTGGWMDTEERIEDAKRSMPSFCDIDSEGKPVWSFNNGVTARFDDNGTLVYECEWSYGDGR